jgi:Tfp pilus assembly protein PilF
MRLLRRLLFALAGSCIAMAAQARPATTCGAIAVANLDYMIAQAAGPARRIELMLARSRFLGDYDALERAVALAEHLPRDAEGLLLRARARAASHRFEQALADLRAAEQAGADPGVVEGQRAAILIATGRAPEAVAALEARVATQPGYASHSALASAYAETGRYGEADRAYRRALESLATTSPFPHAWVHFALGVMWAEQAGDRRRGEAEYDQALAYLPQFAVANIHKAEMEFRRGELRAAQARLMPLARMAREPEALALLGQIERQAGHAAEARRDIALAGQRYRFLLQRQPLAFADHAAEFYLAGGADARQAWRLAMRNLDNRQTPRAFAIAIRATVDSGRNACGLVERMRAAFNAAHPSSSTRIEWERSARAGTANACTTDRALLRQGFSTAD